MSKPDRFRVLLVEDDAVSLALLVNLLHGCEFDILTATNGKDAYEIITNHHVDIIITDTNMPSMDGIDLLKELKAKSLAVPVIIFFSGSLNHPQIKEPDLLQLGADRVLAKPYSRAALLKHIFDLLKKG